MRRLVVIALLGACGGKDGPSAKEQLDKARPQLEPKLVVLDKIAKEVASLPPASGTIKLAGPPMTKIGGTGEVPARQNAAFANIEDLGESFAWVHERPFHSSGFANSCYRIVRHNDVPSAHTKMGDQKFTMFDNRIIDTTKTCLQLRYLVVTKVIDFKDFKFLEDKKFIGGTFKAEAHVFDIETGAHAGGVTFEGASSSETSDPESDLEDRFNRARVAALTTALPDFREY